jgi:hypothetical protein
VAVVVALAGYPLCMQSEKRQRASLAQPGCRRLDPRLCKLSAYRKAQRTVNKQEASERNACIMEMATGDSQLRKKLLTSRARFSSKNAEPTETWLFHIIIWLQKIQLERGENYIFPLVNCSYHL